MALQHQQVVFQVLADLQHARIGEQRLQRRERLVQRNLAFQHAFREQIGSAAMLQRDVAGSSGRNGERDADEIGLHRVERIRLGVERDMAGLVSPADPALQGVEIAHAFIGGAVDLAGQRLVLAGRGKVGGLQPAIARGRRRCRWLLGRQRIERGRNSRPLRGGIRPDIERLELGRPRPARRQRRIGIDRADIGLIGFADTLGDGGELHRLEEGDERHRIGLAQRQMRQRRLDGDVVDEADELARDADLLDHLGIGQGLAALGLLDLAGPGQQRFQIAIFGDELGGRLDADAGRAGHVVGRVARQRLHVDDLVRRHAEILDDLGLADLALGAEARALLGVAGGGVVHGDARPHELHQVLVGRDDQHIGAGLARLPGIGRDQVVGLVDILLDRDQPEGAHRLAHQRELRDEIRRRLGAIALIGRVDRLAERVLGLVEDDGEMGRLHAEHALAHELEQFRRRTAGPRPRAARPSGHCISGPG